MSEASDMNVNYRAFIESSKIEVFNMERNFNARLLSRTGFVFQEMKDLEYEVVQDINNRRVQINNPQCILTAGERIIAASAKAGTNSQSAYQDIMQRIEFARFLMVYPTLAELSRQTYAIAVEPFTLLGFFNPLTEFNRSVEALKQEVDDYSELFEAFVEEIITEMISLNSLHLELSGVLIDSLEETRLEFSLSAREIQAFLMECE
jgi:hypothetical protein